MFGLFRSKKKSEDDFPDTPLLKAVEAAMPDADRESVRIVASIAGLLGSIAYADRDFSSAEEGAIRAELARVHALDVRGIDAICEVLRRHIVDVASVEATWYARALRESCDRAFRTEILQALVDLAAADDELTHGEANVLRRTATSLGLSQEEYNAAQARHKDKLSVLR